MEGAGAGADFFRKSMKIEQKALEPLSSRAFRII